MDYNMKAKPYLEALQRNFNSIFKDSTWNNLGDDYYATYEYTRDHDFYFTNDRSIYCKDDSISRPKSMPSIEANKRAIYYYALKLLGFNVEYIVKEPMTGLTFNKGQSANEVKEYIQEQLDKEYKRGIFNNNTPTFKCVHVPMKSSSISGVAKEEMQKIYLALGYTEEDAIDNAWLEYFKPSTASLFKVYYKEDKGTLVITDYCATSMLNYSTTSDEMFETNELNRLYYGQFVFRGEFPEEYIEDVEECLIKPSVTSGLIMFDCRSTTYYMNALFKQTTHNDYMSKLIHIFSLAYEKDADFFNKIRKDTWSAYLNTYAQNQISNSETKMLNSLSMYKNELDKLDRIYQDYLNANAIHLDMQRKLENFADHYLNTIDKVVEGQDFKVELDNVIRDRYNENVFKLIFSVKGTVRGIDIDDLELLKEIQVNNKEHILHLLKGDDRYAFYFGVQCSFDPVNIHPNYYGVLDSYMPNPHLKEYNCWGNTPSTLYNLDSAGAIDTMFAVFFKACLSLNVRDGAVMRQFYSYVNSFGYKCILDKETNELLTMEEYIDKIGGNNNED